MPAKPPSVGVSKLLAIGAGLGAGGSISGVNPVGRGMAGLASAPNAWLGLKRFIAGFVGFAGLAGAAVF